MKVSSIGGLVMELHVPDRNGNLADVVLGFDSEEEYDEKSPYFGALIGRFGNRTAKGKYSIDGVEYSCAINNGENSLHGGLVGFDKREWIVEEITGEDFTGLVLTLLSEDGDEGYPGNLSVEVIYKLTDANEWVIEYKATTDKSTVVNLTQHSYFNLKGHDGGLNSDHIVYINADAITPVGADLIPTGEFMPVEGTAFDFRVAKPLGQDIEDGHKQIEFAGGYDHNFVLNQSEKGEFIVAAKITEPTTGRTMQVETTEPGVQFYAGNFLDGSNVGKQGVAYGRRNGFCFETQHFPDSPNQPNFPSTRLNPGETYQTKTVYTFGVE